MKATQEQKRERLMAAAEAAIEELLAWDETNLRPNLTQLEDEVLKLREEFGRALVAAELAGQEAQQPAEGMKCSGCGQAMRYKGQKPKLAASRAGEMAVERGYYYCPECEQGIFPPGPPTGD
jgi:hypothetical protein